jgi:2-keto-4-pentenoate hydratase/2-oxohepta-3-ene-1,7-dioic acid hydratase in catechol pathway
MKLISFDHRGRRSYGVVLGERVVDLGERLGARCPTLRSAIEAGIPHDALQGAASLALSELVLLPPIIDPPKILCVGLNYRDHAKEGGFEIPSVPSVFMRATNTLAGEGQPMLRPKQSTDFDYEGELAVVIGRGGRHIPEAKALEHVFGYTCFNDGSVRDFQFKHSLTSGKNFPTTGPLGPWIVTADEIPDPSRLTLTTRVNGKPVQHKGLDDMIFNVPQIIAYLSGWTQLEPGDVIATGTPEGVGFARKPPLWLKPGDAVEVEISSIGTLHTPIGIEV